MSTRQVSDSGTKQKTESREPVRREILENDEVLVIETTYPKQAGVPLHVHRFPHLVYVVEGGTLETKAADGRTEVVELRPGQTFWRLPQAHSTRNLGSSPVRIVEVEIKSAWPVERAGEEAPIAVATGDVEWIVDPLDPRRAAALLLGDPTKPGPYTVRYRVPAGYKLGLHRHSHEHEHITVLSGAVYWSAGEEGSGTPTHEVTAGGFTLIPAGTLHRLWVNEETIIQLTGVGPRTYHYLSPAEDPRART